MSSTDAIFTIELRRLEDSFRFVGPSFWVYRVEPVYLPRHLILKSCGWLGEYVPFETAREVCLQNRFLAAIRYYKESDCGLSGYIAVPFLFLHCFIFCALSSHLFWTTAVYTFGYTWVHQSESRSSYCLKFDHCAHHLEATGGAQVPEFFNPNRWWYVSQST